MEYNETINQTGEETGIPQEGNDVPNEGAQKDAGQEEGSGDTPPTEGEVSSDIPETPEGEAGVEEKKEW